MKNIGSLLVFLILPLVCCAQKGRVAWLPEQYVQAVVHHDSNANQKLIPIEGFLIKNGVMYILTYRGEITYLKSKKVRINNKEKLQLLYLAYRVNLMYNSREWVDRFSKAQVYLSEVNGKFLLEIVEGKKKNEIYFISEYENYKFHDIQESEAYLVKKYNK